MIPTKKKMDTHKHMEHLLNSCKMFLKWLRNESYWAFRLLWTGQMSPTVCFVAQIPSHYKFPCTEFVDICAHRKKKCDYHFLMVN